MFQLSVVKAVHTLHPGEGDGAMLKQCWLFERNTEIPEKLKVLFRLLFGSIGHCYKLSGRGVFETSCSHCAVHKMSFQGKCRHSVWGRGQNSNSLLHCHLLDMFRCAHNTSTKGVCILKLLHRTQWLCCSSKLPDFSGET